MIEHLPAAQAGDVFIFERYVERRAVCRRSEQRWFRDRKRRYEVTAK